MRHSPIVAAFLASILLLVCDSVTFAQFRFSVTPLGEDLHRGRAVAINDSGAVAGLYGEEEVTQTFLWTAAGGIQLFPTAPDATWARAADINNAGSVVVFDSAQRVWLWQNGALHELSDLHGTGPNAINSQVEIVGTRYVVNSNKYWGFRWINGVEQQLPAPQDTETVSAIGLNEAGDIAGAIDFNPTLWQSDGAVIQLSQNGYAYAVNSSRWVVGADRSERAFIWTPGGGWQDMGVHPAADEFHTASAAFAINDAGHAVGFAEVNTAEDDRPFLWTSDTGMLDLNALLDESGEGWVLQIAQDINNSDQIVGVGTFNGQQRAFLLTPVQVPEPAAAVAVLGCLAALASRRR